MCFAEPVQGVAQLWELGAKVGEEPMLFALEVLVGVLLEQVHDLARFGERGQRFRFEVVEPFRPRSRCPSAIRRSPRLNAIHEACQYCRATACSRRAL